MWLFLGTEVLLFAGLFLGYTVYRWLYHDAFKTHSQLLNLPLGTVNTVILISSSFTVAWAYHSVKVNELKKAKALLVFTIACAVGFLVIKYFEYAHKIHEGMLPGKFYSFKEIPESVLPGSNLFLRRLLPGHRAARLPRHRGHERAGVGAVAHRQGQSTTRSITSRSSWERCTGTWSTWCGSSCFPLLYLI
jgi:hypothetical protein